MSKLSEIIEVCVDRLTTCGEIKYDIVGDAVVEGCREGIKDAIESLPAAEDRIKDLESYLDSDNSGDVRDAAYQQGFNAARMQVLQGLQNLLHPHPLATQPSSTQPLNAKGETS